ncbi:MAG: methyltransferase [Acidobacteriota bacterium]|nr:methyltransferase [Acidobacteriota bacterium]
MIEVNPALRPDETLDTFYKGKVLVLQRKNGFRFSVDAPLLASFIQTRNEDEILEIGTGCGIIPMLLSVKPFRHLVALEVQQGLADLARRNIMLNHLDGRITVLEKDFRQYTPWRQFDIIFSNPPYIPKDSGYPSQIEEKNIAKHEILCSLQELLTWTKDSLKSCGSAYFILPESRREEFEEEVPKCSLKLKRSRLVFPREGEPANFYLAECGVLAVSYEAMPPLFLYGCDGKYTEEAETIFSGQPGR